ncbi:MAG: hypothetical protein A3D44_02545 [Candidatus Staskawiczbacteria bacterium RIFCSPHIGHO2_02_FULL_42_22]|uniref:Metallo-beta-lactamase domain-containing protein 1 n=1 Tax=Candidatus Staskawiczbacteria bacterium RIFCSPHIGHO2_02_FULL_42_22 TaxID=1802207 RepID=A0A1G2I449_9BACT|nr:MAG: hypothetical protein A3D44_02545 [Candidatus Staskawiczbacteria bacterium RIFCSPHIGHO2_02_FULL_42_22]
MAEVKVLIEGFYIEQPNGMARVGATVSLVRDKNIIMVVDPGTMENQQVLIDALAKEKLTVNEVTTVAITHSHIDHYRNVGMFPNANVVEYWGIWKGVMWLPLPEPFSKDVRIVKTPGHDYSCLTFLVTTADGVVAICGDVFFKKDGPMPDPFATDTEKLLKSRALVIEKSDWIIPGHAGIYKVK